MDFELIKDLLFRLADDDLIIGHRNSEWTGMGPILEEDIAFSSMAQDEVGHAQAYYMLMHEWMEEAHPDQVAFNREASAFRSCHLVEYPIGDYAYSLVRHALYDIAESIRLEDLSKSSFSPLAELAKKLGREEKYHLLHAHTWISQLGSATEESNRRLQEALNEAFPVAYSIFEPTAATPALAEAGVASDETVLMEKWEAQTHELFSKAGLQIPVVADKSLHFGGRKGQHTEHLAPMLKEMTEVFAIDTTAKW